MPDRDQLYQALRNADAAGDTAAAQRLASYIQSLPAETPTDAPTALPTSSPLRIPKIAGPSGGNSTTLRTLSGAALGVADLGNTALNVLTAPLAAISPKVAQWNRTRNADFEALTEQNKDSTAFKVGRVAGNVAATAPVGGAIGAGVRSVAALPRLASAAPRLGRLATAVETGGFRTGAPVAATLAGKAANLGVRAAGGAITGAASAAAVNPGDAGVGALTGAALPPVLVGAGKVARYGGQAAKSLVEPFTQAGRGAIVARTLARYADNPNAIAAVAGGPSITGALPTLAESTADRGIARLQDTLSVDPQIEKMIGGRLAANNAARVSTLQGIARTPAERDAAVAAVEARAKDLYGKAFEESVDVTPALGRLAGKPSVQKAEARAIQLAREQGIPFQARLDDMRPKTVYAGMRDLPESSFVVPDNPAPIYAGKRRLPDSSVVDVSDEFSPLTLNPQPVETTRTIPSGSTDLYIDLPAGLKDLSVPSGRTSTFVDIPPVESVPVRDMHTLKMGMDALLSDPTLGIAGREAAAVKATRNKLLDQLPESYQVARRAHIEMNKPVNQMDIGTRLLQQYSSATKDLTSNPTLRAEAFNRALQDEAKLIKQATGVKGIKRLEDVMQPEQMAAIRGVADELGRTAAVAKAGSGAGSPTAQRWASQNILHQLIGGAGLPSSLAENVAVRTAAKPLNWVYGDIAEPQIQQLLANAMLDPNLAAELVRQQATGGRSVVQGLLASPLVGQPIVRAAPLLTSDPQ